jgi:hypothetical protein
MPPLQTFIALAPLAVYFLLLGSINISRRPLLTTGSRDSYVLGLALSGFVIIGPLELFIPDRAPHPYVWFLMLALYSMCLTLFVLMIRPRLVIYNITAEQLRPVLADVISQLDQDHQWAGDSLVLPKLGVQLHVEKFTAMRNISLVATASEQSYRGWVELERALTDELRKVEVDPNPLGMILIVLSVLLLGCSMTWMAMNQQQVASEFFEILRIL